jgi:hypothetical protein
MTSSNLTRLDGKFPWLLAFEDAIGIGRRAPIAIGRIASIRQQAAHFSEETECIDGWDTVASRQRCDLSAMRIQKATRYDDQAVMGYCLAFWIRSKSRPI